jgi:hypothetical protein
MGQRRDADDFADELDEKKCLANIRFMLEKAEVECTKSELILKTFLGDELEANKQ